MQIKLNAVKAAVLAVTLAFSGASFAANATYGSEAVVGAGGLVDNSDGQNFSGFPVVGIPVLELTNKLNAQDKFLAFCIQPNVDLQQFSTYTAVMGAPTKAIQALYETSYASTLGNADKQVAFQLALWELAADDGDLFNTSGSQYFAAGDTQVTDAFNMLSDASQLKQLKNTYTYLTFSGTGANGKAAQQLLGVTMAAAVPEASTWAMLGLGLGLVGFMGRRKSSQDEKFA